MICVCPILVAPVCHCCSINLQCATCPIHRNISSYNFLVSFCVFSCSHAPAQGAVDALHYACYEGKSSVVRVVLEHWVPGEGDMVRPVCLLARLLACLLVCSVACLVLCLSVFLSDCLALFWLLSANSCNMCVCIHVRPVCSLLHL
jgi:hypothetical protein